ncbi:hypothetical protein KPL70_018442 [Citrus sinensis]|nr:hypothetical protein KPL70_018442 [Citrus sinensis]
MASPPSPPPSLGRRNSISTTVPLPTKLSLPAKSSNYSYDDVSASSFELISLKSPSSSYTSLKDLLPSSGFNSPTATGSAANSAYEISIRNRLVKQAAWAYLQPMSASPDSSTGSHFLCRIWIKISSACFQLISRMLSVFRVKETEF